MNRFDVTDNDPPYQLGFVEELFRDKDYKGISHLTCKKSWDQNQQRRFSPRNETLLHFAARYGMDTKLIEKYIKHGVPVDAINIYGSLPIDLTQNARIAKVMLEHMDEKDRSIICTKLLQKNVVCGPYPFIRILCQFGADPFEPFSYVEGSKKESVYSKLVCGLKPSDRDREIISYLRMVYTLIHFSAYIQRKRKHSPLRLLSINGIRDLKAFLL